MGKLKDSFAPTPKAPEKDYYTWIVPAVPTRARSVRLRLEAPHELTLRTAAPRVKASDVVTLKAKKFGDLLQKGYGPGEAAHKLKTTVRALMDKPQTQKVVRDLIETYTLDAAARRLLQRALVNKGMVDESADGGDKKLLQGYLKLAAEDSELAITGPGTQVNIAVGLDSELKKMLDSTIPVPEIAAPVEVVDAEFEDTDVT